MTDLIRVHCPQCSRRLRVPSAAAGILAGCPDCGQQFHIPRPEQSDGPAPDGPTGAGLAALVCGHCGQQMEMHLSEVDALAGHTLACPACGWLFEVGGNGNEGELGRLAAAGGPAPPRRAFKKPSNAGPVAALAAVAVVAAIGLSVWAINSVGGPESPGREATPAAQASGHGAEDVPGPPAGALAERLSASRTLIDAQHGDELRAAATLAASERAALGRRLVNKANGLSSAELETKVLLLATGGRLMLSAPSGPKAGRDAVEQSITALTTRHPMVDPRTVPEIAVGVDAVQSTTGERLLGGGGRGFFE